MKQDFWGTMLHDDKLSLIEKICHAGEIFSKKTRLTPDTAYVPLNTPDEDIEKAQEATGLIIIISAGILSNTVHVGTDKY